MSDFKIGPFIQDVIYGATPWGIIDKTIGKPLSRIHLAMPYNNGQVQDLTSPVDINNPVNREVGVIERTLLGVTPDQTARDLQNDRRRFYATEDGKNLQSQAELSGFPVQNKDNKYRNTNALLGDITRGAPNANILNQEGVSYGQIGLDNVSTKPDGTRISAAEITQRAQAFKARKELESQIQQAGGVPKGASMDELSTQLRELKAKNTVEDAALNESILYGTVGPDGKRTGASVKGQMEIDRATEELETSRSTRNVNEGTLGLNQNIARNAQTQQEYRNSRGEYEYEDRKAEAEVERLFQAAQADAKYAADLETIKLQNAAEMERYNLMLQNDRDVRRGESISDLIASLVLFGGAMG